MRDLSLPDRDWSFHYGTEILRFSVRRQAQRRNNSIAIHVEPEGIVLVDAPVGASREVILAAVRKRARWIQLHVAGFLRRRTYALPREYVSGEAVMYLGRRYLLKVIQTDDVEQGARLFGAHLEVRSATRSPMEVRAAMDRWFRSRARIVLAERMGVMLGALRWKHPPPPVRLQAMEAQWGSCSPAGRLTLNPWLVKAPRDCIDYVVLHELCHLKEHNHSPRFYRLLDKHMPLWRGRKERLDELAELILNK